LEEQKMNTTTKAIIERLPKKPIIAPADIAAAYGMQTNEMIITDIKTGKLAANKINNRYIISRAAAEEYIAANEYQPDEG
jgi:hypothetical protein